jgi:hypothetical protein
LRVSDCIHNLRQSLDHLAYRLAVFVGGDPPAQRSDDRLPYLRFPADR